LKPRPLLSDIHPTKTKFNAGDRILVRISVNVSSDQQNSLKRAINKYAGNDVNSLIINCMEFGLLRLRLGEVPHRLTGLEDRQHQPIALGVANLKCSKIEFQDNDQLVVYVFSGIGSELQKKQIHKWIREWTGKDVEVIVKEGKL